MSRIVSAVNIMILNSKKIAPVIARDDEYYFVYDQKHKWSISESDGDIVLCLYPKSNDSIEHISLYQTLSFQSNVVTYSAKEIGSKEAWQSWRELLTLVKEKALGVSDVLDDIISSGDDDIPF